MANNILFGNRYSTPTSADHLQFYSTGFENSPGQYNRTATATPSYGYPVGGRAGWLSAFGTGGYIDEPSLLEGNVLHFLHR